MYEIERDFYQSASIVGAGSTNKDLWCVLHDKLARAKVTDSSMLQEMYMVNITMSYVYSSMGAFRRKRIIFSSATM